MSENNKKEPRDEKLPDVEIDTSRTKSDTAGGESVMEKGKFARWLENFFYHYKWHTAIVAFVLIVAIVCTVTMCGRQKPDVMIVYAGGMDISTNRNGKDTSNYELFMHGLESVAKNSDKDTVVSLSAYWWLSNDEIQALNTDDNEDNDISPAQDTNIYAGFQKFDSLMTLGASSKYYIWFMSPALYNYYAKQAKDAGDIELLFENLEELQKQNNSVQFYDTQNFTAIKLSSLAVYYNTELNMLPEDTLIVLRAPSGVGSKSSRKAFEASRDYLAELVNY